MSDNSVEPPNSDGEERLSEAELLHRPAGRAQYRHERQQQQLETARLQRRRERQLREQRREQLREQRRQQEQYIYQTLLTDAVVQDEVATPALVSRCWPRHEAWHAAARSELPDVLTFQRCWALLSRRGGR